MSPPVGGILGKNRHARKPLSSLTATPADPDIEFI